ncbi:transient receptor potential cation channel subfamily A member 1b [Lepisosteus oculatus]|uniref:transient receptor potential cation channel subfamily A member 1b n=1 Tax=Lepisosteus oculatus TaxID=7918 RepID=UPI003710E179
MAELCRGLATDKKRTGWKGILQNRGSRNRLITFHKAMKKEDSLYECVVDDDPSQLSVDVFQLALEGSKSGLEDLINKNPDCLLTSNEARATPLHFAAAGGHHGIIHFIVNMAGPEGLNAVDDLGNTPLHWAVEKKQMESCNALLQLGADPNILNNSLLSPLHLAVNLWHNNLVDLLLCHSSTNSNLEGDLGNTPSMLACSIDNHEALGILLKHGAKLCRQNKLGHFAVHAAAFAGAKKSMEIILKKGEEMGHSVFTHINYLDKSSSSPLHLAVHGGNIEVIKLCIDNGAKIDLQQCDKSTALHFACTQGATEAVKLMLSSHDRVEEVVNIIDGAHQTPLHKASIFDHVDLVEYLLLKGAKIESIDCKGHTPLLLATRCGAWRTVELLLNKGANVKIRDKQGCNFVHLAVLQPKGLKNLPEKFLQHKDVKGLLNSEDNEGCTPLHYACRLGVSDSVNNMLGMKVSLNLKSKAKKSALHFAAEYGRINTCRRLLETMVDTRLLNEGDEKGLTPLHLASVGGHTKVVDLLLRKGALFLSDHKGWTCLHHAAAEGYTQTMKILLGTNIKLMDKVDEDGNTALHLAAREGHTGAVKLLLSKGAEITLNKSEASFMHEAIYHGRKEVAYAVIESERCTQALITFKLGSAKACPVLDMIEFLPEAFKFLLDKSVNESEDDVNSYDYCIQYNFQWLQAPMHYAKLAKTDKRYYFKPLGALNAMVRFNRIELLTHPVCKKYLEMKWLAYGVKVHGLNLAIYTLGLLPLSHLIVSMRPSINETYGNITVASKPLNKQHFFLTTCMMLVFVMNVYTVGKELVQIFQQRRRYFRDFSNFLDWSAALFSILFVVPLMNDFKGNWHWQCGAIAVLLSWVNFLLYLQRFEWIGIYVVMFGEILRTLICIVLLFFFLMLAFALSFYALMLGQRNFGTIDASLMQTFVMMVGELSYQDNFLIPSLQNKLPFPHITFVIFIWFTLLMPILLMNLLIGLAVGDIAEVQRNASLKRIAMQIDLHTSLEEKLPYWFMKRVDQETITVYPNRTCAEKVQSLLNWSDQAESRSRLSANTCHLTPLENELQRQKYRLKDISNVLEKQHNLLKLIIQKMEITTEADENDGPDLFQHGNERKQLQKKSKWFPLLKAVHSKMQ